MPRISTWSSRLLACLFLAGLLLPTLLVASWWVSVAGDPVIVDDRAGLLSVEQRAGITLQHAFLLEDHDIDYRIVTTGDAGDMVRSGAERFKAMSAGSLSKSGRGLLLMVDPVQDKVRLEVGYALEGVLSDVVVAYLEERQMVPFFQADRVGDGILATTELLVGYVQGDAAADTFDAASGVAGSGGAGATAVARIGKPLKPGREKAGPVRAAGGRPVETLDAYFDAMGDRDGRKQLDLYSEATRQMLKDWVMTPAQMDNVLRTYRSCRSETPRISSGGSHAVIRYPATERRCSPWFLVLEDGAWKLDFVVMQQAVRFGRDNSWRFAGGLPGPYAFAFQDWTFDRHGFPESR